MLARNEVEGVEAVNKCATGVDGDTPADHAGEGGSSPTVALFRKADYWVRTVKHALALRLVEEHHYARGGSNTATFAHGLFLRRLPFNCLGVAWWIPPTPSCGQKWWPENRQAVLNLTRLVLVPDLPKNAATFLLMQSVRLIRKAAQRWRCLITQADTWQGHTGHIYKVAGWEDCGLGEPEDVWTNPATGKMVARKAGPKTRTRAQMRELGFEFQGKYPKHRFRFLLPTPDVRRNLFSECRDG